MSEQKQKVHKTLRIQSKENIETKRNSFANTPKERDQGDEFNTSFEQNEFKNMRNFKQGLMKSKMPKVNHVVIDAMKMEEDYEYTQKDLKENLDDWYQRTKSKLKENQENSNSFQVNDVRNQNQQKMLIEGMKEKYKSPNVDSNILNSILKTDQKIQKGQNQIERYNEDSPFKNKQMVRNSFSYVQNAQINDDSDSKSRNSVFSSQPNFKGSKKVSVFNANAANTQGNICTSLTLLQQYNPNKEYINPELVKKKNIQKIVHNIIQDKMQKFMNKPKEYSQKFQGIKTTNDLGDSVQNETLKNFKSLRKYFNFGQKIDYDQLLAKILTNKQLPSKFFNFTEDEINPASSFKDVEPELLSRYLSINKAIEEKKSQQRVFRIEVAKWVQILKDNQNDLITTQNRQDELMQQYHIQDKSIKRVQALQKSNAFKNKAQQKNKQLVEYNEGLQLELDKLNGQQQELSNQQQKLQDKQKELEMIINTLNQDIEAIMNHIDNCDKEVEKLKMSRINLKTYLRQNYVKMLKKDLSALPTAQKENISLVWVIKSMNSLGEAIERGDFPQYIDSQAIEFLQEAAQIEQEVEDLKSSIRNYDFTKFDLSQNKKNRYEKVIENLNKNSTKSEIQKKLKVITEENLQVKKPIFQVNADTKRHEIQWVSDTVNPGTMNSLNKYDVQDEDLQSAVHERQKILEVIQEKQRFYQKIKDLELVRHIHQNEKREDPNLLKKLICLFGTIDGSNEFHNYTHLTQCFIKKMQESKNFSFMTSSRHFKIKAKTENAKSLDRAQSSHDLKTEQNDNLSVASSKLTSSRQNLLSSTSISNLTDKYINTIKRGSNTNQNQLSIGSNLQIDAFDTFMGLKSRNLTSSYSNSRIGTSFNNFTSENKSNLYKPYQSTSLRNLSINF
ncbi:hypothetical protein TTHERM_00010960 (macronuclear) [Tetrahymena thermophila SB210]|uniref:Uncharacterized protein n=1 Tax=Tetrahymena thermophila (strain SB210) TaxID=312017 RepID=Q22S36_TETTS|nr:hypothetical protein TTHERM_00010960 [Tetrahymena thermophila SB210]EAR87936.2 hypothetical protein TTHERM_00010960 [Tetrahymena thermophila SB210]|eukprot:XP_001008181.2 hypothetical protein TTHERM_00010960 [Tetrahymena thermophila SB210]